MSYVLGQWKSSSKQSYMSLYAVMLLVSVLLLLRDVWDVAINKYIFLAIVGGVTFAFPVDKVLYLITFMMPLYVGVPGNYITLVFLIRLLGEAHRLKITGKNLIFCILSGGYALGQAILIEHMKISQLVFFPGLVLVMFIYSLAAEYDKKKIVLFYCLGSAVMGLIMLISTLQVHDFIELLTSSMRLGTGTTRFADANEMNVSMDPNYYGLFAIAAISTGVEVLSRSSQMMSKGSRVLLIVAIACCLAVALIGLSRAFFLALIVWALLYALSRKKAKTIFFFLIEVGLVILVIYLFMPDVIEAIFERLGDESAADGNGRFRLVEDFYQKWGENILTILFGVGLWTCNVHCVPLEALFGGGLVFVFLFGGFVCTLGAGRKRLEGISRLQQCMPMVVTAMMSLTVPALTSINILWPLYLVGLYNAGEAD